MTDELKKKLQDQRKDEMADHDMYCEWAKLFKEQGMSEAAHMLKNIAREEEMHAMILGHILEEEK